MPRTGNVFSLLSGSKGTPNTTIQSAPYNAQLDDFAQDANLPRPVTAGGTGATSPSGARTALGLVPGTDIQAYDALLKAIADLTTTANQMIYMTGSDTVALTTVTAYGRSLMDDADAVAARTTLGLGALAVLGSVNDGNWSGTDLSIANGGTGASSVAAAKANLGLGNVDNTSDANKPVSSAQQATFFSKTGGAISGSVEIAKVNPDLTLHYPGVFRGQFYIDGNGSLIWRDVNGDPKFYSPVAGGMWIKGLGDLGTSIAGTAQAWANDRVSNLATRLVSRGTTGTTLDIEAPSGAVVTGYTREGGAAGQVRSLYYRYFQLFDPVRGWVGATFQ